MLQLSLLSMKQLARLLSVRANLQVSNRYPVDSSSTSGRKEQKIMEIGCYSQGQNLGGMRSARHKKVFESSSTLPRNILR